MSGGDGLGELQSGQWEVRADLLLEGPPSLLGSRVGEIRHHWEELNLGIKVPYREEGSRLPFPDVPPCLWSRDPAGGWRYVTFHFLHISKHMF